MVSVADIPPPEAVAQMRRAPLEALLRKLGVRHTGARDANGLRILVESARWRLTHAPELYRLLGPERANIAVVKAILDLLTPEGLERVSLKDGGRTSRPTS